MARADTEKIEYYILAFQRGEEKAYDYFFRLYFRSLCYFARRILNNTHDAEDLVQECFAKLWLKHPYLDNPGSIQNFLYATVRNACLNELAKKKVLILSPDFAEPASPDQETVYEDTLIKAELLRRVFESLDELPSRTREVFQLYYLNNKNDREIGELLSTSPFTVRNQRRNAIRIIRTKMAVTKKILLFISSLFPFFCL